jgi:hypothetical protein
MPRLPALLMGAAALAGGATVVAQLPSPLVMPWLCLEVCGDKPAQIAADVAQVGGVVNAASFELFNLGPNSQLITNNLTAVAAPIRAAGALALAMVSSYPYPPAFLSWMREVFAAPQPFIDACVAAAAAHNLSGINIDWEPPSSDKPTPADAAAYAHFLDTLATALHAHGLLVTVDVATWSKVWDLRAIAATAVDAIFTMNTYTDDDAVWLRQLADVVAVIPADALVVGLETTHSSDGRPYNTSDLALRFDALKSAGIRRVGLWSSPIPALFFPFLNAL